ncbi:hypothetical protein IWW50_001115, partial [Coemansia erecta]
SINSSDQSNSSIPASPIATDEARVSFDGEAIHPTEIASIAVLASHGTSRSMQRRSVQPFSSLRPPTSAKSVYSEYKGGYSRSEVSLSKEQVVWSPQISTSANESSFGYFQYARIPSADDSSRGSKRPPSSAALNSLTVSAAMINRHPRNSAGGDRKGSSIHSGSRITSARPAIDLGLSMRSDLEHRVRSYSESGGNPLLHQDERPHSSMGFHETVAGAPIWSARPDAIHARRHSPHSASLRHFRAEKFNPHRLSMMSVGSQSSRQGAASSDSIHSDGLQSDVASISTSYSSQGADRLLPPTTSQATVPGTVVGKRRAQTMNQN